MAKSKTIRQVKFMVNGGIFTPMNDVESGVEIPVGALYGIKDGVAVLASNLKATMVRAVGLNIKSSTETWGEAFQYEGINALRAGENMQIYDAGYITGVTAEEVPAGTPIGTNVYVGAKGMLTVSPVAGTGNLSQLVGKVVRNDAVDIIVKISIMDFGVVLTA